MAERKRRQRSNGEGTVSHRADGRWEAKYSLLENGRWRRRSLYGATREGVAHRLREALAARDVGNPVPGGRETVGSYLVTWLEGIRPTVRPRTHERYEEHVRLHLVPTLGRIPLTRLTPAQVQRTYAGLLSGGLGAGTVRRAHATLRRALSQAVRWRLVASNAAALTDPPRAVRREMTALSHLEARRLLDGCSGERLKALYVLAVTSGLRQGELLALRWPDVDLDQGWLRVTGTLTRTRAKGLAIREPKTTRSRRRVELSATAAEALRRHRAGQLQERLRAGATWQDKDLVFCGPVGQFLQAGAVLDGFHALLERTELPRVRFHDLRHTAATLMLSRAVHPKIVSEMLGHSTIATTLDLYSHVTETMQRGAAKVMDDLLG